MDVDDEDEDAEGRAANDNANQNNSPDTGTTARRGQRRQRPAPTVTKDNDDDEDEDDEVAIAREKTSLKCPITLLPFRMPVTSRKCPHSFEKEAIFGMINHSGARLGGAGGRRRGDPGFAGAGDWGVQAVKCPVCEQVRFMCFFFVGIEMVCCRDGMGSGRTVSGPPGPRLAFPLPPPSFVSSSFPPISNKWNAFKPLTPHRNCRC